MRRLLIIPLLLSLLLVSCENPLSDTIDRFLNISFEDPFDDVPTNTFLVDKGVVTTNYQGGNDFSFVILTDLHYGCSDERADTEFLNWFAANCGDVDFVASLGDETDYSEESQFQQYKDTIVDNVGVPVVSLMGNHDSVNGGLKYYKSILGYTESFFMFRCKNVEFYVLDNSLRTLGAKQLRYFKEAMASSSGNKRIVLAHIPLYGDFIEMWGTLYDSLERSEILEAYYDGGVGLSLSGHIHTGVDPYTFRTNCSEYVLKSFVGKNSGSDHPRWYRADYNGTTGQITITCYKCDDGTVSVSGSEVFTL